MKQIEVTYTERVLIDTEDFNEARNIFNEKYPRREATEFALMDVSTTGVKTYLECKYAIGHCEETGKAIFEDDQYDFLEDSVMILREG